MNALTGLTPLRPAPAFWFNPSVRAALADRDIPTLYRHLQARGWSQQRIARLTGQSQPEISAIIHGRKVMAYEVLARIIDGLGIPRGLAGLGHCDGPEHDPRPPQAAAVHVMEMVCA